MTPAIAGIVAALVASLLLAKSQPVLSTWGPIFLMAAMDVVLPLVAAAVTVVVWCRVKNLAEWKTLVADTLMRAVWIPPLVILLTRDSLWAIVPACLLAVTAAPRLPARGVVISITAAVLLQTGLLFAAAELAGVASLLMGMACALVTVMVRPRKRKTAEKWMRLGFAAISTFALLTTGFSADISYPGNGGGTAAASVPPAKRPNYGGEGGPYVGGNHSGIILWPEEDEPKVRLVPPLPMMRRELGEQTRRRDPLSIPFFGVYWFFRFPHKKPPPDSITVHGSPVRLSFRSADYITLQMEAHQNFGVLMDLSCCRRIQVVIRNADRYARSVSAELILANTALDGKPSLSLGKADVTSIARSRPGGDVQVIEEALDYPIPSGPTLKQFDEATVRFQTAKYRSHRSAKIAIDRFVLTP